MIFDNVKRDSAVTSFRSIFVVRIAIKYLTSPAVCLNSDFFCIVAVFKAVCDLLSGLETRDLPCMIFSST